jgi:hypothetical protein
VSTLRDEDLILYYYGEASEKEGIEEQLEASPETRQRYAALSQVLDSVAEPSIPHRPQAYGSGVWHRISPEIGAPRGRSWSWDWLRPRRQWGLAAVMALLLAIAFLAGRQVADQAVQQEMAGLSSEGRERILLMTVVGHLERSEMLLLELVNTRDNGDIDLSLERQLANELGQESRLYRQAAREAGKMDVAVLLEQLETVLVELSNGPQMVPSSDLGELRVRLDEGDVLFKVRVLGTRLREEVNAGSRSDEDPPAAREI